MMHEMMKRDRKIATTGERKKHTHTQTICSNNGNNDQQIEIWIDIDFKLCYMATNHTIYTTIVNVMYNSGSGNFSVRKSQKKMD